MRQLIWVSEKFFVKRPLGISFISCQSGTGKAIYSIQ